MSQRDFAENIGVVFNTYRGWEARKTTPSLQMVFGCLRLGIDPNWLLTGEGAMMSGQNGFAEQPQTAFEGSWRETSSVNIDTVSITAEALVEFLLEDDSELNPRNFSLTLVGLITLVVSRGISPAKDRIKSLLADLA